MRTPLQFEYREKANDETLSALCGCTLVVAPVLAQDAEQFIGEPLVKDIFTADPSGNVFEGKVYVYPSHDWEAGITADDLGSHFAMVDYHELSMDEVGGPATDHGGALDINDVPWAGRQMWAPDAAEKDGNYFFYFPAKDKQDIFRAGAAIADSRAGPFVAWPKPIKGSYSIDPAAFKDDDAEQNMYMGGIWAASCSVGKPVATFTPIPIRLTTSLRLLRAWHVCLTTC